MEGEAKHMPSHTAHTDDRRSDLIGRAVPRVEDERLLRGHSRYVSDLIATSGALRVKVLRSRMRMQGFSR